MTFGVAGPWDVTTPGSPSKLNLMTVPSGAGNDLAGLDKTLFKIIVCTATGSGLIADHVYCANTAADSWIDISSIVVHTHADSTQGGDIETIFRNNPSFIDTGSRYLFNLDKADWTEIVSGTGATTNDTDGTTEEKSLKFSTGATSGSGATLKVVGNLLLDFSKRSHFQTMLKLGNLTSIAMKAGVNCETVTATDDDIVKYEAQVCTATNANWNIRTASGTARSESDTGTAFTTNQVSIKLEHYPDIGTPKVDLYLDSAAAFTKTSNIPISGSTGTSKLIKFSLKNSTTTDKISFMYGCRLRYTTNSQWR